MLEKKYWTKLSLAICALFLFTACADEKADENSKTPNQKVEDTTTGSEDEVTEEKGEEPTDETVNTSEGSLFTYDLDKGEIVAETYAFDTKTAESVVAALVEKAVLPVDTKVLGFEQTARTGKINLNEAIYYANLGGGAETLMLDALAQSLLVNLDLDELIVTVEGKNYESGHILLTEQDVFKRKS
ncbi:MAG: GerMN domain-containing protein [Bacilli bacterium]